MPKLFGRTARKVAAIFGVLAVTASTMGATLPQATSPGTLHAVSLEQTTGTPGFDDSDGDGKDSSASNDTIRTNDTISYEIEVAVGGGKASAAKIIMKLPAGEEAQLLPPYCEPAKSSITPKLAEPASGLTRDSYKSLPPQTITCHVGDMPSTSTQIYTLQTRIRPEVPNGHTMSGIKAVVTTAQESKTTQAVAHTVSAKGTYDVQLGHSTAANSASLWGPTRTSCEADTKYGCVENRFNWLVSAPAGGKGNSPMTGSFSAILDVSPEILYGSGVTSTEAWKAAGELTAAEKSGKSAAEQADASWTKAWDHYKPVVETTSGYGGPGRSGKTEAARINSVRDSGTQAMQHLSDGRIKLTVTGADTTAWTYPSKTTDGATLPQDRAFVTTFGFTMLYPARAVVDFGINSNEHYSMQQRLQISELTGKDLSGSNASSPLPVDNNYRLATATMRPSGTFDTYMTAIPGSRGSTPPADFRPSWRQWWHGLPGSGGILDAQGVVMEGQVALDSMAVEVTTGASPVGIMVCSSWNEGDWALRKDNYPGAGYNKPSNGAAAWVNAMDFAGTEEKVTFEYGNGAAGAGQASACGNSDAKGGWFSDPSKVPGNNPAKATEGIYTAANKVRMLYVEARPGNSRMNVAVALHYGGGKKVGDVIGFYGAQTGSKAVGSNETDISPSAFSDRFGWSDLSTKDFGHTMDDPSHGRYGDRAVIGTASGSATIDVKDASGAWQSATAAFVAGSSASLRIKPALTAAVDTDKPFTLTTDACLPPGVSYVGGSGSISPTVITTTAMDSKQVTCAPGSTLVSWTHAGLIPNAAVTPITFKTSISAALPNAPIELVAGSGVSGDVVAASRRSDPVVLNLISPRGAYFSISSPRGEIGVNPYPNTRDGKHLVWVAEFMNRESPAPVGNTDLVSVLPRNGFHGSTFSGAADLKSVTVKDGLPAKIFYSTTANLTIGATGAVSPTAGWVNASKYQGSLSAVTAVRVTYADYLAVGQRLTAEITMDATNNRDGNVYRDMTVATADGFGQTMIPEPVPIVVNAASTGDHVWIDLNGNGLQDSTEKGLADAPMKLTGSTPAGNTVSKSTKAASDGSYLFTDLPAGTYTVAWDKTWFASKKLSLTKARMGSGDNDSAASAQGEYSFTLTDHQKRTDADAGLLGNSTLAISRESNRETDWIYRGQFPRQILTIKNTGDFSITNIAVTDTAAGPVVNSSASFDGTKVGTLSSNSTDKSHTWSGALEPGKSVKVQLNHLVDSNAATSAVIRNTVKGAGTWIGGPTMVLCTETDLITPADCFATSKVAVPFLTYSADHVDGGSELKDADGKIVSVEMAGDGLFGPGERMDLFQTVTNAGNVPLSLREATAFIPGTDQSKAAIPRGSPVVIQPGKSATLIVNGLTHASQRQVDHDDLRTALNLHSYGPNEYQLTAMNETVGAAQATTRRAPDLFMSASAHDDSGNGVVEDKENGHWRYTLVNTGNLTLSSLDVQDAVSGKLIAEDGFDGRLSPGEKVTLERVGRVPAFDDEGLFRNVGTASAKTPLAVDEFTLAPTATTWLSGKSSSGLDLVKTLVDASGDGILSTGEAFHYTFKVVNNSDETYTGARLEDPEFRDKHGANSIKEPQAWAELADDEKVLRPGQSAEWTSIMVSATRQDAQSGFVENRATVTAVDSNSERAPSNISIARVSAVGTPVMIAAGSGAGLPGAGVARTQAGWVTGGVILTIGALSIVWMRRKLRGQ